MCQFMAEIHLIRSKSESASPYIREGSIECHKYFNMKYGQHPGADMQYTVDAPDTERNIYSEIFPFSSVTITINSLQRVCGQTVAKLHIATV